MLKISDVVKNDVFKKMYTMLRSRILKIKYLILLTTNTILNPKLNEVKKRNT